MSEGLPPPPDRKPRRPRTRAPRQPRAALPEPPPARRPPIRIEVDREALASLDKRAIALQLGIGLAAGWLASWIVGGSGLLRYVVTGLVGSFVGSWLLRQLGLELGIRNPVLARIVTAALGAGAVVLLARLLA